VVLYRPETNQDYLNWSLVKRNKGVRCPDLFPEINFETPNIPSGRRKGSEGNYPFHENSRGFDQREEENTRKASACKIIPLKFAHSAFETSQNAQKISRLRLSHSSKFESTGKRVHGFAPIFFAKNFANPEVFGNNNPRCSANPEVFGNNNPGCSILISAFASLADQFDQRT
jgi:hypothetical protein